jgi:hypothetical protein
VIQQQAHDAVARARAEKEEALLSVRREMEEQHAAKVKKYQAMIEEVKAERDERYHELQQELQSEVAIRGYALSCALHSTLCVEEAQVQGQVKMKRGACSGLWAGTTDRVWWRLTGELSCAGWGLSDQVQGERAAGGKG